MLICSCHGKNKIVSHFLPRIFDWAISQHLTSKAIAKATKVVIVYNSKVPPLHNELHHNYDHTSSPFSLADAQSSCTTKSFDRLLPWQPWASFKQRHFADQGEQTKTQNACIWVIEACASWSYQSSTLFNMRKGPMSPGPNPIDCFCLLSIKIEICQVILAWNCYVKPLVIQKKYYEYYFLM